MKTVVEFKNYDEARECLGFPKGITLSVNAAKLLFRKKIIENHPDKVQDKKAATKRTQQLNNAWEYFTPSIPGYAIDISDNEDDTARHEGDTTHLNGSTSLSILSAAANKADTNV